MNVGRDLRTRPPHTVLGYAEPLSVAPGDEIRFMVSTLDGRPEGPGLKTVELPTSIDGEHAGTPQPIDAGSYVIVEHPDAFGGLRSRLAGRDAL